MRVAGPLLDFPTELKNRLFPLKVCNPSYFLHNSIALNFAWLPIPYLHALLGQRYFVHDIDNLVDDENVDIDKNCDVVADIVDNISVCVGAEREKRRVQSSCLQILQRPR